MLGYGETRGADPSVKGLTVGLQRKTRSARSEALRDKRPGDKRYPFGIPEAVLAAGLAGQWVWQWECPVNKLSFTQKPSSLSLLPLRKAPLVP